MTVADGGYQLMYRVLQDAAHPEKGFLPKIDGFPLGLEGSRGPDAPYGYRENGKHHQQYRCKNQ
ncbi:MAG: hypothetical protein P8010_03580 [Desulfosarcinaceae bacterium]|jgi:hypothetical protein